MMVSPADAGSTNQYSQVRSYLMGVDLGDNSVTVVIVVDVTGQEGLLVDLVDLCGEI